VIVPGMRHEVNPPCLGGGLAVRASGRGTGHEAQHLKRRRGVLLVQPALPDRGYPRACLLLMRCSSGCRETSGRERWHFSTASDNNSPWCARDTSPGIGTWPPPIRPASERVWWGARNGRVVTKAVRSPVRPAPRWIRVISRASARVMAGKSVVSRRASFNLSAPVGPMRSQYCTPTQVEYQ
jgi:hypothetical protein